MKTANNVILAENELFDLYGNPIGIIVKSAASNINSTPTTPPTTTATIAPIITPTVFSEIQPMSNTLSEPMTVLLFETRSAVQKNDPETVLDKMEKCIFKIISIFSVILIFLIVFADKIKPLIKTIKEIFELCK